MILLEIFWTFFKIGLFTIGGGYAMIPLIAQEVVATEEPQETVQKVEAENIAEIETEVSNMEEVVEPVIVKEEKN